MAKKNLAEANESATVKAGLRTGTKAGKTGTGVAAKKGAAATKKPAAKKPAKPAAERTPRAGSTATYKVIAKDNPFREGTTRHALWAHIKANKSAADARAADAKISISFLRELSEKDVIELTE